MRNCLCILLFLVLTLTIPVTSAYAYGDGGGGGGGGGGSDGGGGGDVESTSSDTTNPPSGFTPANQESEGSEIANSSETDPGNEEEVAELVDEVTAMGDTPQDEEGEDDGSDPDEESTSDENATEEDSSGSDEETTSDEGSPDGNREDNTHQEIETAVGDIDPLGSDQESGTTGQPSKPGPSLIGTQGTLPGTRSATLDAVETEINDDGSVSSWAEYTNDTWVHTTVKPDGTTEVVVHLASGTMIRPGEESIHSGGSVNPLLDWTITALETAAAAGAVAGWVLTVTPAGFLAGAGIKATWATTVGVQAVRAGADVYGAKIDQGASQSEAALSGLTQTATNAVVTTATGKFLADPYKDAIGEVTGDVGHAVAESAINQLANVEAARLTEAATGTNPGYGPGLF